MPNPAREASLYALRRCRRDGAWSSATLAAAVGKFSLDARDAAFASRLTLGVLENERLCDWYIGQYSATPARRLEPAVLDVLRMGTYQLLFMDRVPQSAAVNESVELCRSSGCARAAGLVNAVLRKLAANKDSLPEIPGAGTAKYLAIKYSHPTWLAEKLVSEKGYDFTREFFRADNGEAPLYIQVNTIKTGAAALAELLADAGVNAAPHPWQENCLCVSNPGEVAALPGFREGLFYVQDPAARACADAAGLLPGMEVLDACAAPGGKSFAAAIAMRNTGRIVARDIHEKKTKLIDEGARRLGITVIETAAADAREKSEGEYDAVFADVPCSGLGVIRSKPEIRYRSQDGLGGLPAVQGAILDSVAANVKPGGVLMYSTCTVLREENEESAQLFLAGHPEFSPESFEINGTVSGGMRTFWPHTDGTDGFFICKLRKNN